MLKKKKKYWLVAVGIILGLLFLCFYLVFKIEKRGYVIDIAALNGGPLRLTWTKVGYPAVVKWEIFSKEYGSINVLFYQVEIPDFKLRSPMIPFPVKVKDRSVLPVILVRKEWFPTLMRGLKPGKRFTVLVKMIIKRQGRYYKITRKVKVLYTGSVFLNKGGKK